MESFKLEEYTVNIDVHTEAIRIDNFVPNPVNLADAGPKHKNRSSDSVFSNTINGWVDIDDAGLYANLPYARAWYGASLTYTNVPAH